MKVVFLHSHKFRKIENTYYSLGGLSDRVLERYAKYSEKVVVLARIIEEEKSSKNNKYSMITNPKVEIKDYRKMSNKELKKIITSADRVIARLPCMISLRGIQIAKKEKIKYLIEVVGCAWDAYWNHSLKGKIVAFFMFLFMRASIKNAPKVLYVSNTFLQKRYPTNGEAIACSDVVLNEPEEQILINRINRINDMKKQSKIVIGTIGAVNVKHKGQQYVIKVIQELKKEGFDIEYQIVGSGNNQYLRKIVDRLNIQENIKFIGSLPHENIFTWLDNLDIYIQPSNTEGLCRALIEAMSRACPCIASDAGGNIELIDNEFVFKKKKIKDLKRKIILLINDEYLKQQSKSNFKKSFEYIHSKLL